MAKITLPNGVVVEGSVEQVNQVSRAMGYGTLEMKPENGWYNSSMHGWMKMSDMNLHHLRNALLKKLTEWVEELRVLPDSNSLANAIINGNTDPTFVALLRELRKRNSRF